MTGRLLYKYVAFDKPMNVLKLITESSIKFTAPIEFNDPFDCNPCYKNSESPQKERPDLFARLDMLHKSPAEELSARQRAINRTNAVFNDGSFHKQALAGVGILSLSRTPWHVLMWSHYAANHTGFVAEFEEPSSFPSGIGDYHHQWLIPFEVTYTNDRPVIDRWGDIDDDKVNQVFMYKSSEWAYEEEERVIKYRGGPGIFGYEPSLLKSIIAGCNISDENFSLLSSAVKQSNRGRKRKVQLYRAKLDDKRYELKIPGMKKPRSQIT